MSVSEHSEAVNAGMAKQTERRRLALVELFGCLVGWFVGCFFDWLVGYSVGRY